ncbi:Retrotransposon gag protein [Abeliophyllum distichum]|uniref:Retrotransposon gag protein n=1 Tax=Abeliophyllum distichum TaxID=126358 RepID=A0ABD1T2C5_9LAMI
METLPTAAPPLAPVSLAPPSAPHFNSLASSPNPHWEQPSWVPTPMLAETPMLSLEQRLDDMMGRKIAEAMSKKSSRQQSMVLEEDHFLPEMMAVPFTRYFEQPKMEKYDGSSDSVDHLRTFVDLMRFKHDTKTAIDLMQLTQDKDELLKDFIARFNRATLEIKDIQMSAVVTAMMSGTRSRPFKMSLSKNPPDTMHELLKRGR